MRRRVYAATFWGAVTGVAVAAGLTGISGLGIVMLAVFGIAAGVFRAKLLA